MPVAPGRFSMITGCCNASLRRAAIARAVMSVPPPVGYGITSRIGRSGACARLAAGESASEAERMPIAPKHKVVRA